MKSKEEIDPAIQRDFGIQGLSRNPHSTNKKKIKKWEHISDLK